MMSDINIKASIVKFNDLNISGDFTLIREKDIEGDKDFFISTESDIINVLTENFRMQISDFKLILIRAGYLNNMISIHFMRDRDVQSSFLNFDIESKQIIFERKGNSFNMIIS